MEELKEKVYVKIEDSHSLGLPDLYKAACNQVIELKSESGETYPSVAVKTYAYATPDDLTGATQITSNLVLEASESSILDLDKGIPVQIINRNMSSYSGDSDLLQRFLHDHSISKPDSNPPYVTILNLNSPPTFEINNLKDTESHSHDANTIQLQDYDFNSSDSFASTESIIPKSIKCPKCPKKFMFKSDLTRHDKNKHKKKVLACPCCNQEFTSKQNLTLHEKSRTCNEFACHLCNKTFKKKGLLTKHLNYSHNDVDLSKSTMSVREPLIKEELLTHFTSSLTSNIDDFPCDICNKRFRMKRTLQAHIKKKHLTQLTCHICQESFDGISQLTEHMKMHEDFPATDAVPVDGVVKKPFKCEHCSKEYISKYNFNCHVLKHSSPKVCRVCNESFGTEAELNAHSHLHVFQCNVCLGTFNTQVSLNRHFKRKHGSTEQEACTQTEEEVFHVQNVNVVVDPSSGGSESFLLATPISGLGSMPIFITQQAINVPFSVSS